MRPEKTDSDFQELIRIKCHCGHFLGEYKQGHFHAHCEKCKQLRDVEELKKRRIFDKQVKV